MATSEVGSKELIKTNCCMGNAYLGELRGLGIVADTVRDASPLGAFDPPGKLLRRESGSLSGEATAAIENTLF